MNVGKELVITQSYKDLVHFNVDDAFRIVYEGTLFYLVEIDGITRSVRKESCELLEVRRIRIINEIINN
jgi:hypothetical protein